MPTKAHQVSRCSHISRYNHSASRPAYGVRQHLVYGAAPTKPDVCTPFEQGLTSPHREGVGFPKDMTTGLPQVSTNDQCVWRRVTLSKSLAKEVICKLP